MKAVATLLVLLLLAGCAGRLQTSYSNTDLVTVFDIRAAATERFARKVQEGRPLLQIGVDRLEVNTVAFLDATRGGVATYLTPEGIALYTRGSLLVGTKGFGGDLLASDVAEPLAAIQRRQGGLVTTRFHTFIDGENRAETRTYRCIVENSGAREIQVSTAAGEFRTMQTVLMQEDCKSLDQEFINLYWVAPGSGRIVQSRQWAGETTEHLVLRIVLP